MIYVPYFLLLSILGLFIMSNTGSTNINRILTIIGILVVPPLGLFPLHDNTIISFLGHSLQATQQDTIGYYFTVAFTITLFCGTLYYLTFNEVNYKEIGFAFIFSGIAITAVSTNDLIITIILIQIIPIIAAVMVAINNSTKSKRTAIQLLVVNLFGTFLFTIGADAYINLTHNTSINNLTHLNHYSSYLMLAGLLILIATPPFSNWLVEELSVASPKSSIFLSIFTPKIALVVLIKMFAGYHFLLYAGILLTFYGLIFSLFTPNLRKILAYAIIHQLGFIFIVLSVSPEIDNYYSALNIFIFTHILYELCFFTLAAICHNYFNDDNIHHMQGFFHYKPFIGILLLIASLNSLGFPFTSGFIGKILIAEVMEKSGNIFVYYFTFFSAAAHALHIGFKILYLLYIKAPEVKNIEKFKNIKINTIHFLPICIILLITVIHFIVLSILIPNINSIENIYHEIRVAIIGIIMFAFLVRFTNHNREHAIYEINNTIIQYTNNLLLGTVIKVKNFYNFFHSTSGTLILKALKSTLVIQRIYYNSKILVFIIIVFITLSLIVFALA